MHALASIGAASLAMALDHALGDPPNRWHPVAWMGRLIAWGERYAMGRTPAGRTLYGAGLVLGGLVVTVAPVVLLEWISARAGVWVSLVTTVVLLKCVITWSGLRRAAHSVSAALDAGDLPEARRLLAWHLVSRDTSELDANLVAAAAVESVAENLTDALIAPLCFFAAGGIPAAWGYRFCNTCDSMLGYHDPIHEYLGKFAARLDDVLNWLPARLAGLLIAAAAVLAGEDGRRAWHALRTQHGRTASPNAGWTMAAIAGALHVTLEKVGHYRLEGGTDPVTCATIGRAIRVIGIAILLFFGLFVTVMLTLGRFGHGF